VKTLIETYRNHPGEHCGSVAMRGLLRHYCGLELPEGAVFGLGSGVACVYITGPAMDPQAVVFGRTMTMESDLGAALGVDYRERPEEDDAEAWEIVREEVLAGRPTMLSGDIFYLDYREYKVHFPAHRFVLLGFDDATETAFIADRIRPEPEACSYGALIASRNPPEGISTHNLWGRFHGTEVGRSLIDAARLAIDRCARRMLGVEVEAAGTWKAGDAAPAVPPETQVTTGIAGIRRLAGEIPSWSEREDAQWLASFNASCIEKFGNGGGNFRRLYADFLDWARDLDAGLVPEAAPALARKAADGWTATSDALFAASQEGAPAGLWGEAAAHAAAVADVETDLYERLADRAG
jgi:hypothetical protein